MDFTETDWLKTRTLNLVMDPTGSPFSLADILNKDFAT
jgi:hypothetical protein